MKWNCDNRSLAWLLGISTKFDTVYKNLELKATHSKCVYTAYTEGPVVAALEETDKVKTRFYVLKFGDLTD